MERIKQGSWFRNRIKRYFCLCRSVYTEVLWWADNPTKDSCHVSNTSIVNSNPRKDKKRDHFDVPSFWCFICILNLRAVLINCYIEKCVFQVLTVMIFMARRVLSRLVSLRVSVNSVATEVCIFIPVLRCSRPIVRKYSNEVLSPNILTRW